MSRKQKYNPIDDTNHLVPTLITTINYFFPRWQNWIAKINDPRNQKQVIYPTAYQFWMGLLLFLTKSESLYSFRYNCNTSTFLENINKLSDSDIETLVHHDTLGYFYEKLPPEELAQIIYLMINTLIRSRRLESSRLFDEYYRLVIDGTSIRIFHERHCEHCLTQKNNDGSIYYYHKVVSVRLVTPDGFSLSVMSEFIENEKANPDVQDCELMAGYRLIQKIHDRFPQLRICLLADTLYANQTVFAMAKDFSWQYCINFKRDKIPYIADEADRICKIEPENNCIAEYNDANQEYRWANDINHEGRMTNYIHCQEIKKNGEIKTYEWVTNFHCNSKTVPIIANEGGRDRWKIENEGFNTLKNNGYEMEHNYDGKGNAIKNFYYLIQIAHILDQLMTKGSLLKSIKKEKIGGWKQIARRLLEELRKYVFDFSILWLPYPGYIKLDSC